MDPNSAELNLPLSRWRRAGNTIYISGHGAVNREGHFAAEGFEAQFHWTMAALKKTLLQAGAELSDLVQVRVYVQDPDDLPLYNRLYRQYFQPPFPARTTLTSCLPLGLEFEIEGIAVVGERNTD
jgi:2-iminobutanoate/2-iminopropanoate deaminase